MQSTINIAQEFYKLNNIEINPNKTELVVLKSGKRNHLKDLSIWMGNPRTKIIAKNPKETTRFLGVWISIKNQKRSDIFKARSIVGKISGLLKHNKCPLVKLYM